MNIPIETVVELLIENAAPAKCGGGQVTLGGEVYDSLKEDDLRGYIRDYLSTLVPKPVKLSECEEGKPYTIQHKVTVHRSGNDAFADVDETAWIGYADHLEVIQPVEVK